MLFAADRFNRGLGHIGLSIGARGRMISALDMVTGHRHRGQAPTGITSIKAGPRSAGLARAPAAPARASSPFGLDTCRRSACAGD